MRFAQLLAGAILLCATPATAARYVTYEASVAMTGFHNNYPVGNFIPSGVRFLLTITIDTLANPSGYSALEGTRSHSATVTGDVLSIRYRESMSNYTFNGGITFAPGTLAGLLPEPGDQAFILSTTAASSSQYVHYFDSYSGRIDSFAATSSDQAPTYLGMVVSNYIPTDWSGVPEPATWAMMISGFGLVGRMMRRRSGVGVAKAI